MSPTQRSLDHLRTSGYIAEVCEHWNPYARKRKDLFGVFDIIYLADGFVGMVQTTSGSNVSARVRKVAESEFLGALRKAGVVMHVHGWRKNSKGRYVLRVIDIS